MAVIMNRAGFIGRRVEIFREEQEEWKADDGKALACFAMQELLDDGVGLYDDICRLDETWHAFVYKNPDPFDQPFSERISNLFRRWLDTSKNLVSLVEEIRDDYTTRGFDVALIDKLESYCDSCEAIVGPSDVETELADEALRCHRAGQTEAM
jgi:hypothetical protein